LKGFLQVIYYLFIKIAKIDPKKYFILGSYALREHRKINDLDINIERKEFMKLELVVKKGFGSRFHEPPVL
jgi:hypothetical protein